MDARKRNNIKMRTLNQLYLILWNKIKDEEFIDGLCHNIGHLVTLNLITEKEYYLLRSHFESQKPTKNLHSEFLKSETWKGGSYWWSLGENINPVHRKSFIRKMIEITEDVDIKNIKILNMREFKLDDKVYTEANGKGIVTNIIENPLKYNIEATFENNIKVCFTKEGKLFQYDKNPTLYLLEEKPLILRERLIEVSHYEEFPIGLTYRRVLVTIKNNKAICWTSADTIEESKKSDYTDVWSYWREIEKTEEIVELTIKDISEGKGTGIPPHLIRIKE